MILCDNFQSPIITWLYKMKQMNEIKQVQDDEIDLFELFQTLWDGKWLISAFVATAVLLGGGLIFIKEEDKALPLPLPVYESKLVYSVKTRPPFYNNKEVLTDFHKKFHSINVFENWKKRDGNVSITFEDFSTTIGIDGFVFSKDESQRLATLVLKEKGDSFVLVKSNQLPVLDDFFKYVYYINELLKNEYVVRSKEELEIIKSLFKYPLSLNNNIVSTITSINRYIKTADRGANVLDIQRPTIPKKIESKSKSNSSLILALSVVLGGIVGVMYVLISNAIRNRKESSAKS
jgi:hypothetical protein